MLDAKVECRVEAGHPDTAWCKVFSFSGCSAAGNFFGGELFRAAPCIEYFGTHFTVHGLLIFMSERSFVLATGFPAEQRNRQPFSLGNGKWIMLLEVAVGFLLIMVTVWTPRPLQTRLFWISAAWLAACTALNIWRSGIPRFRVPSLKAASWMVGAGVVLAAGLITLAAAAGTLHGLFGAQD